MCDNNIIKFLVFFQTVMTMLHTLGNCMKLLVYVHKHLLVLYHEHPCNITICSVMTLPIIQLPFALCTCTCIAPHGQVWTFCFTYMLRNFSKNVSLRIYTWLHWIFELFTCSNTWSRENFLFHIATLELLLLSEIILHYSWILDLIWFLDCFCIAPHRQDEPFVSHGQGQRKLFMSGQV